MILPSIPGVAAAFADEREIRDAYWQPGPGETALDAGAGVGSYTIPALLHGADVIAVEPDPAAAATLFEVARVNGVSCEIYQVALFNGAPYPAEMRAALEASEYSYLIPPPSVTWSTLDALVEGLGLTRLDWVKIDVEGAELGVLEGGRETLGLWHPRLLIEEHSLVYPFTATSGSKQACVGLLHGLGYTVAEVPYGPPDRTYLVAA